MTEHECVYPEKGQPGLRPGYGKHVESRLTQLEDMVRGIHASIAALVPTQPAPSLTDSGVAGMRIFSPNAEGHHDVSDTASAIDGQQQTDPSEVSRNPLTNHDPIPPNLASDAILRNEDDQFCQSSQMNGASYTRSTTTNNIYNLDTGDLPPAEILTELADLFFEHAYPCNKLFYKPSFVANLFQPERQVLCHAITAVAFRFWDKAYPEEGIREAYMQRSRDRVTLAVIESISLITAQALAVIALDSFGSSPGSRIVSNISLLTTAVHHLGLVNCLSEENRRTTLILVSNESTTEQSGVPDSEKEAKRRLFWIIFILDRFVSLSTGSKCTLRTDSIKQRLPTSDDLDWGRSPSNDILRVIGRPSPFILDSTNPWRYLVEILGLLDRTHEFLLRPVDLSVSAFCDEWQREFRALDEEICTWYDCLPHSMRERGQYVDPMQVTIQATYYA